MQYRFYFKIYSQLRLPTQKKLVGFCIVEQKSTIFLPPQSTFEKIASINSVAMIGNFPVFTSFIEKMEINRIYPLEIAEI